MKKSETQLSGEHCWAAQIKQRAMSPNSKYGGWVVMFGERDDDNPFPIGGYFDTKTHAQFIANVYNLNPKERRASMKNKSEDIKQFRLQVRREWFDQRNDNQF